MKKSSSSNGVFVNVVWRLLERCGAQGVTLLVTIVLARLLEPSEYGVISLVTVITSFLQVIVDGGLGNALIQKKEADNKDFSTVFYFNLIISVFLYIAVFLLAPSIARFYQHETLTPIVRVIGLSLIFNGLRNIQIAYVSRQMIFKKFFIATLFGTIVAAVVGIYMAYTGFGVWSLVAQYMTNIAIDTVILWSVVKWKPTLTFSIHRLKALCSYSWKLLISSIVETMYTNVSQLIIGRKYSTADLACYSKGKQLPSILVTNVNSSIKSVMFPALSKHQDDILKVKEMTRSAIKVSIFFLSPLMIGLASVADTLVFVLLTEKWLVSVPYIRMFCFALILQPLQTTNKSALKAISRSDIYLKTELLVKIIGVIILITTMNISVTAIAIGVIITSILEQCILAIPSKRLIKYGLVEQVIDIAPAIVISGIMGCVVYIIGYISLDRYIVLCIQIATGIFVYVGMMIITKNKTLKYLLDRFAKRKH